MSSVTGFTSQRQLTIRTVFLVAAEPQAGGVMAFALFKSNHFTPTFVPPKHAILRSKNRQFRTTFDSAALSLHSFDLLSVPVRWRGETHTPSQLDVSWRYFSEYRPSIHSTLGILLAIMRFMNFTYLFTYLLFAIGCLMQSPSRSTDAPKVNCSPTAAYLGDRNVAVGCTVRAKPPVTALFWIIDANGTSVSEGDLIADHWTLESVCKQICARHV